MGCVSRFKEEKPWRVEMKLSRCLNEGRTKQAVALVVGQRELSSNTIKFLIY